MENVTRLGGVLTGLFVFGVLYNWFVGRLEGRGHDRGYMAFIVILGCAANIVGAGFLIGWDAAWLVFLCFAASGISMTIGSMCRYIQARDTDERVQQEALKRLVGEVTCQGQKSEDTDSTAS
jgi:hypothetical protein